MKILLAIVLYEVLRTIVMKLWDRIMSNLNK
jgi:hypothetical protein